jgi:hypothetical protein
MPLSIFVAMETGICMLLPSKLSSASAAISAFRPCLLSRCLAMDYSITICFDSQLKQLYSFLVVFYSTFEIIYPNDQSYMPNDSVNIEIHIKTYLLNTCVFNVNPKLLYVFLLAFLNVTSWIEFFLFRVCGLYIETRKRNNTKTNVHTIRSTQHTLKIHFFFRRQ